MAARINKDIFTKVKVARELLKTHAEDIYKQYMETIAEARSNGNSEAALKGLQWLIEHMPADEDGNRIIDTSIDKNIQPVQVDSRPAIQIGIQLGGVNQKKQLPAAKVEIIDAKPS